MVILERHDEVNAALDQLLAAAAAAGRQPVTRRRSDRVGPEARRRRARRGPRRLRPAAARPARGRPDRDRRVARRAPGAPRRAARRARRRAGRRRWCSTRSGRTMYLRRFGVLPGAQGHGRRGAADRAAVRGREGYDDLTVVAREELPGDGRVLGAPRLPGDPPRRAERRAAAPAAHRPCFDVPDADAMRALGASLAGQLRRRRPGRAQRRARRRQDHVHPGARRRARGPRRHHLADVRDRAGAPAAGRRAGAGARRRLPARWASTSSTTSTSTPRSTTPSRSSSGARGSRRGWPSPGSSSGSSGPLAHEDEHDDPTRAGSLMTPVGPRWYEHARSPTPHAAAAGGRSSSESAPRRLPATAPRPTSTATSTRTIAGAAGGDGRRARRPGACCVPQQLGGTRVGAAAWLRPGQDEIAARGARSAASLAGDRAAGPGSRSVELVGVAHGPAAATQRRIELTSPSSAPASPELGAASMARPTRRRRASAVVGPASARLRRLSPIDEHLAAAGDRRHAGVAVR